MTGNIYLDLTNEFNAGRLRAILSSGQAVVVHGLALASKDGDWILREEAECFSHILQVLEGYSASYRLGAPLDMRWMSGGWSAHFEFNHEGNRIRCDFVSRPPRLASDDLANLWEQQESGTGDNFPVPTLDLRRLALLKATRRERDYSFIGEIARRLPTVREQILWSRSARDLASLAENFPEEVRQLVAQRPLLSRIGEGRRVLQRALDEERYFMSEADENRLHAYAQAAQHWNTAWTRIRAEIADVPLRQAHKTLVQHAEKLLPEAPDERF
ncbi:MAG: hypothetical protein KY445_04555 [Armatimonadetes bacterium]|nr:hypothetical protein [Armatimonadota bacterium]